MNLIRHSLMIGLALATLSRAWADETPAAKKDLAQLQGEWTMVSGIADGYALPEPMLADSKRVCKGDEVTVTVGGQQIMKAKITLDPTQTPKAIDYQVSEGPTQGKRLLGIYEIDGDSFKSCFAAPGDKRPADFTSKPGEKRTASVWKRHNKAASEPAPK